MIIFFPLLTNQPPITINQKNPQNPSLKKPRPSNSSGMGSSSGMASISATKASASFSSAAAFLRLVETFHGGNLRGFTTESIWLDTLLLIFYESISGV